MARVWITGARGFIGRHLAYYLHSRGDLVSGLGHGAWPESEARRCGISSWLNGDVSAVNLTQLRRALGSPDLIYHLAGGSSVAAALQSPREDFGRTVSSTAELLEWLRLDSPSTRLVAVSSAAVYGSGHAGLIAEQAQLAPFSTYGFHKLMMEKLCVSYGASYGVKSVVARLFSVYGPGLQKQLLWDYCSRLSDRKIPLVLGGTGLELRDWTDVRDVVRALSLVETLAASRVDAINIGTGVGTSVGNVAERLSACWPIATERRPSFTGQSRAGDPFSLLADPSRLRGLGFSFAIDAAQGLEDYVKWYVGEYERVLR